MAFLSSLEVASYFRKLGGFSMNDATPFELAHCVEIYVPSQCRCGKPLPEDVRKEALEDVVASMGDWFGGGSVKQEKIEGFWRLASGNTAYERVDIVRSNATPDALEEHQHDVKVLTASLANRLTQEGVACRIDEKMLIYPSTMDPKPHRCAGGVFKGELPVPLQSNELASRRSLQGALQRLGSLTDLRDLFCKVLHYEYQDDQLTIADWPDSIRGCLAPGALPHVIAEQNAFKIIYLKLSDTDLRKGAERQLIQRIIKDDPSLRGLFVVSDVHQSQWHLVNARHDQDENRHGHLRLRRFRVGPGQSVRTTVERLAQIDIEAIGDAISAGDLQTLHDRAFDVEAVSKEFFNEITNWYFWALPQVDFPTDTVGDDDMEKHRATSVIRLLTRVIFCWFLKEKGLIPDSLVHEQKLAEILIDLDPDSCTYYQGILQNLFFATLNHRMGADDQGHPYRAFAKDEGFPKNKSTYGVDTLYRYEEHFRDPGTALNQFAEIPFLNGGLFECLDHLDEDSEKKLYVDGFSRNKKKRAKVPNRLFLANEQSVDLSEVYCDNGRRSARVRGLLHILHAYNFTVEENTPIDEEIALDPELLGKVFENLLASYNEETKTTARKQTGSFYTPRTIVAYMVDESLKAHLSKCLLSLGHSEDDARNQLDHLLSYTDEDCNFTEAETTALLEAIHTCKILDPACGSGAFPIGMLQKLVHIVHKLDPANARWKQLQLDQAAKISDSTVREVALEAIERDFTDNRADFGRKLYLIENCIYGVDIQPIAIQISKLRFFISLLCDQKTSNDNSKNHHVRPLPNLETKFVAADTLVGIMKPGQMELVDSRVETVEAEIEALHHRHFSIQRREQKLAMQRKLKTLRQELGDLLVDLIGSSNKAKLLCAWDPFDQQAYAKFFDPRWMFGHSLSSGFDIVIGNPPYGIKFSSPLKSQLSGIYKKASSIGDSYTYFILRGLELLSKGSILCLIIPNTLCDIENGEELREELLKNSVICKIWQSGWAFTAAIVDTIVIQIINMVPSPESSISITTDGKTSSRQQEMFLGLPQKKINFRTPLAHIKLREELRNGTIELGKIFNINAGVKLYESGKGIPPQSREIVNSKPYTSFDVKGDDWRTLYRGGDVDRYSLINRGECVRYGPWLAAPRSPELFSRPKLLMRRTDDRLRCCYDSSGAIAVNSCHIIQLKDNIIQDDLYYFAVMAVLNSSICQWIFATDNPQMIGKTFAEVKVIYVERISIPELSNSEINILGRLAIAAILINRNSKEQITKTNDQIMSIGFLDEIIDACVIECYFKELMPERKTFINDEIYSMLGLLDSIYENIELNSMLEKFERKFNRDLLNQMYSNNSDLLAIINSSGKD